MGLLLLFRVAIFSVSGLRRNQFLVQRPVTEASQERSVFNFKNNVRIREHHHFVLFIRVFKRNEIVKVKLFTTCGHLFTIAKINLALSAKTENGCLKDVQVALGAVAEKAFLSGEAAAVLEGCPLDGLPAKEFGDVLSQIIRRSIPTRASMPYKSDAVRGLAEDLLKLL